MGRTRFRRRSAIEELLGMLRQSNISRRNIARIRELTQNPDDSTQTLAKAVMDIVRVQAPRRQRFHLMARQHPDVLEQIVASLNEESGGTFRFCDDRTAEWFWEQWAQVEEQLRWRVYEGLPCWCGSGRPYWHCCAERDDAFSEQLIAEERERGWMADPGSIPWWHPDSGIDHLTRSAYEMFYADPDHPLAIPPPEART